jgi:starch synthase (maltosyl-transferring)
MSDQNGKRRVIIERVKPEINNGQFPIKRRIGEKVIVEADIFTDGHDSITARLLHKGPDDVQWIETPLLFIQNDRWQGEFIVDRIGIYHYTLMGWVDHFKSWQKALKKKFEAGQDISVDALTGAAYIKEGSKHASGKDAKKLTEISDFLKKKKDIEKIFSLSMSEELSNLMDHYADKGVATKYEKELAVSVDRDKALFSSWFEIFPRSCSSEPGRHGTFKDCEKILPGIVKMGFDVLYLTPIHPIGKTNRKGKNNTLVAEPEDVGSPWAIGSEEGGHKAVHPELGTISDFESLINKARELGVEIAMDLAFQCSPDHPYVKEHPEWFSWRPDGTIQFAENPPKKYEDIVPLYFETANWQDLWNELKSVVIFWIEKGVRIFRVDNPHTKPFAFWDWLIKEIKTVYPEVIFLSEAFTRPKVKYRLAKLGFTQSYTYFTWRNTKSELTQYMRELTQTDVSEYFRPNFWPNTPDILPEHLQYGGRQAFMLKLVLAATLSSNYGIYGPTFALYINEAMPDKEEYINSEKYELKFWDWDKPGNLRDLITRVNKIRRENPCLQMTRTIEFYETDNDHLICYGKFTDDLSNIILVVANLDSFHTQSGWLTVPIKKLGIEPGQSYLVHDLLGDDKYIWQGERNYVELNPHISPAHIFSIKKRLRRETDFDYYM